MAGINKAILVGYLGRDPEIRYTHSGTAVANFTMATTERVGQDREERTEWHRIVAFGRLAEICGEYLSKGRQVYIEGRIQTREWEDRDGNKRTTTEIVANNMQMLGSPSEGGGRPRDSRPSGGSPSYGSSQNRDRGQDDYGRSGSDRKPNDRGSQGGQKDYGDDYGGGPDYNNGPPGDDEIPF